MGNRLREGTFLFANCVQTGSEVHKVPDTMGTGGPHAQEIKQQGVEIHSSSASNVEVKNAPLNPQTSSYRRV
jgi:hypothetical protein